MCQYYAAPGVISEKVIGSTGGAGVRLRAREIALVDGLNEVDTATTSISLSVKWAFPGWCRKAVRSAVGEIAWARRSFAGAR